MSRILCEDCYEYIDVQLYGVFEVINGGTADEVRVLHRLFAEEYDAKSYANTDYLVIEPLAVY